MIFFQFQTNCRFFWNANISSFFFPFLAATNRRLIFLVVYYGFLCLVLTPCCSLWIHMIHCGNCASLYLIELLWIFLSLYVSLWLIMAHCSLFWPILAYFGSKCLILSRYGFLVTYCGLSLFLFLAPTDSFWLSVAHCGFLQLLVNWGSLWLLVTHTVSFLDTITLALDNSGLFWLIFTHCGLLWLILAHCGWL